MRQLDVHELALLPSLLGGLEDSTTFTVGRHTPASQGG